MTPTTPPPSELGAATLFGHTCPDDAYRLAGHGKAACGHAALAAALQCHVRDIMHAFPGPGLWVNDARMKQALATLEVEHYEVGSKSLNQWSVRWLQGLGSWMRPGVPMGARNQRTHWVASHDGLIYDINADSWLPAEVWQTQVLPDILEVWKTDTFEVRKTFVVWPNDALSGPRGGEGAPNQQQPANRPDGSLQ